MKNIEYYMRNDPLLDTPEGIFKFSEDPIYCQGCFFTNGEKKKYFNAWMLSLDYQKAFEEQLREDFDTNDITCLGFVDPVLEEDKFNELRERLF